MNKILRMIAKNRIVSALILFIVAGGAMFWIMDSWGWGAISKVIIVALIGVVCYQIPVTCASRLMAELVQRMDDECAPEDLLVFCEEYENADWGQNLSMLRDINRTAALVNMGEFNEAKERLLKIDAEVLQLKSPVMAYLVYNSLAGISLKQGCLEDCEGFIKEASETIKIIQANEAAMKKSGMSKRLQDSMEKTRIELELKRHENGEECQKLDKMLIRAQSLDPTKTVFEVQVAFIIGEIYLFQGDLQSAREKFEDVISRGNRLAIVDRAKSLLSRCKDR